MEGQRPVWKLSQYHIQIKMQMHLLVPNTCTDMQRNTHAGREI